MKRGVCYLVWGDAGGALLDRSVASLRTFHPQLPIHVERVNASGPWEGLLLKPRMFRVSPFESTLFLDADTVVMGDLNYGFEKAERHGLACSLCECPWARRHAGLQNQRDLVEYNTGVIFFTRAAQPVFEKWEQLAPTLDSSTTFVRDGQIVQQPHDDQAAFAQAIEQTEFNPYVLPLNWNFRPQFYRSFFGPIRIWHNYEPPSPWIEELCAYYRHPQSIIQYHELKIG